MQKVLLVRGSFDRGGPSPVDAFLNKALRSSGMRLTDVNVLRATEVDCVLLCVFETAEKHEEQNEQNENKNN